MRLFRQKYTDKKTGKTRASAKWYVEFRDHNRIARRWPAFADRKSSTAVGLRLERLAECRSAHRQPDDDLMRWVEVAPAKLRERMIDAGLLDRRHLSSERTLLQHLDGDGDAASDGATFRQHLMDKGNTAAHVDKSVGRIRRVFEATGLAYWADLAAPGALASIERYLAKLRTTDAGVDAVAVPIRATTAAYYVKRLRQFGRWMVKHGGAHSDHLARLEDVGHAAADRVEWRPLTVEEMRWLLRVTAAEAVERYGVAAADRTIAYRFAFETGIRAGQIRRLIVRNFDLDADPPTVTAPAAAVKRRVEHTQLIKPATAAELARRFATRMPTAPAFQLPNPTNMARMLRADLAAARAAWVAEAPEGEARAKRGRSDFLAEVDHRGRKVVFHSLRHTHGTALGSAGVPQKDIQASLHHTSGRTTERYLHTHVEERRTALHALPDLSAECVTATGTGGAGEAGAYRPAYRPPRIGEGPDGSGDSEGGVENAVFDGSTRIRTENQGIMSPLL